MAFDLGGSLVPCMPKMPDLARWVDRVEPAERGKLAIALCGVFRSYYESCDVYNRACCLSSVGSGSVEDPVSDSSASAEVSVRSSVSSGRARRRARARQRAKVASVTTFSAEAVVTQVVPVLAETSQLEARQLLGVSPSFRALLDSPAHWYLAGEGCVSRVSPGCCRLGLSGVPLAECLSAVVARAKEKEGYVPRAGSLASRYDNGAKGILVDKAPGLGDVLEISSGFGSVFSRPDLAMCYSLLLSRASDFGTAPELRWLLAAPRSVFLSEEQLSSVRFKKVALGQLHLSLGEGDYVLPALVTLSRRHPELCVSGSFAKWLSELDFPGVVEGLQLSDRVGSDEVTPTLWEAAGCLRPLGVVLVSTPERKEELLRRYPRGLDSTQVFSLTEVQGMVVNEVWFVQFEGELELEKVEKMVDLASSRASFKFVSLVCRANTVDVRLEWTRLPRVGMCNVGLHLKEGELSVIVCGARVRLPQGFEVIGDFDGLSRTHKAYIVHGPCEFALGEIQLPDTLERVYLSSNRDPFSPLAQGLAREGLLLGGREFAVDDSVRWGLFRYNVSRVVVSESDDFVDLDLPAG